MDNFKIEVTSNQSKIVQKILFKNDCYWTTGPTGFDNVVKHLERPHLCISDNMILLISEYSYKKEYSSYKRLTYDEFMNMYDLKRQRTIKLERICCVKDR